LLPNARAYVVPPQERALPQRETITPAAGIPRRAAVAMAVMRYGGHNGAQQTKSRHHAASVVSGSGTTAAMAMVFANGRRSRQEEKAANRQNVRKKACSLSRHRA